MASTPEAKVKAKIKAILKAHGAYYAMPIGTGKTILEVIYGLQYIVPYQIEQVLTQVQVLLKQLMLMQVVEFGGQVLMFLILIQIHIQLVHL